MYLHTTAVHFYCFFKMFLHGIKISQLHIFFSTRPFLTNKYNISIAHAQSLIWAWKQKMHQQNYIYQESEDHKGKWSRLEGPTKWRWSLLKQTCFVFVATGGECSFTHPNKNVQLNQSKMKFNVGMCPLLPKLQESLNSVQLVGTVG